jgi:phosphohistidine phosphatase
LHKNLLILCRPAPPSSRSAEPKKVDLADSAKRNAQRFGVWMARQELIPQEVICDSSQASRTAAEKSAKAAGLNQQIVRAVGDLGDAPVALFLEALAGLDPETGCVLVAVPPSVAARFGTQVCGGGFAPRFDKSDSRTVVLLHLRLKGQWSQLTPGCGELVQAIGPAELPKSFPFPDVHGSEKRSRPAYYYRQSAVIPFRFSESGLEILVISTSKRKRWGVPKGIHDPGMTAQASAAKEAMEEGGVLGKVLDLELGRYTYAKWGATCVVKVYPMEVTEMLAPGDWPEPHRGREWLSPAAAARRVHQNDLKVMIRELQQRVSETRPEGHPDG